MIGLVTFTILGLYLWGCYHITKWANHKAKSKGVAAWKYAVPAALLSYGLLFWDWAPTLATHQYLCMAEGGLTVLKPIEQWKKENPGIAETLTPIALAKWQHEANITRVPLNERFIWEFEDSTHWFGIHERDERIVDIENNEILARRINFDSALKNPLVSSYNISFRDYKGWLAWGTKRCPLGAGRTRWLYNGDSFITIQSKFKRINGDVR